MGFPVQKQKEIIPQDTRNLISLRYHTVTRAINSEFWNSTSDTRNSLYVGSYGRGTAIDTSDLDILVELPQDEYERHNSMSGNGQSRLLQAIRNAILASYPRSEVKADGQVVKILFSDDMKFEILPAFKDLDWIGNWTGKYNYPDTHMGGNWRATNPKAEQKEMKSKNDVSNGLLFDTCKHLRRVRDEHFSSYTLSGIVIDSFVYEAIGDWHWPREGETSSNSGLRYEKVLLDRLNSEIMCSTNFYAPGSRQIVNSSNSIECLKKVLNYIV